MLFESIRSFSPKLSTAFKSSGKTSSISKRFSARSSSSIGGDSISSSFKNWFKGSSNKTTYNADNYRTSYEKPNYLKTDPDDKLNHMRVAGDDPAKMTEPDYHVDTPIRTTRPPGVSDNMWESFQKYSGGQKDWAAKANDTHSYEDKYHQFMGAHTSPEMFKGLPTEAPRYEDSDPYRNLPSYSESKRFSTMSFPESNEFGHIDSAAYEAAEKKEKSGLETPSAPPSYNKNETNPFDTIPLPQKRLTSSTAYPAPQNHIDSLYDHISSKTNYINQDNYLHGPLPEVPLS